MFLVLDSINTKGSTIVVLKVLGNYIPKSTDTWSEGWKTSPRRRWQNWLVAKILINHTFCENKCPCLASIVRTFCSIVSSVILAWQILDKWRRGVKCYVSLVSSHLRIWRGQYSMWRNSVALPQSFGICKHWDMDFTLPHFHGATYCRA